MHRSEPHRAPPPSAGAGPGRLDGLTGVRAVAAIWVTIFHLEPTLVGLFGALPAPGAIRAGYLGVDMFFVLSGFVLAWNYLPRMSAPPSFTSWRRFVMARWSRIYPVHAAMLAAFALLVFGASRLGVPMTGSAWSWEEFAKSAALVQAWGFSDALYWNAPSWSISSLWLAYLLFPLVAPLVARASPTVARIGIVACIAGLGWTTYELGGFDNLDRTYEGANARVLFEFAVGALLARLRLLGEIAPGTAAGITIGSMVALVVAMTCGVADIVAVPCLAALIYGLSHPLAGPLRWLGHPVVLYCGRAAFAWYMVHYLVVVVGRVGIERYAIAERPVGVGVAFIAAEFLAIGALTAIVHHGVELPAQSFLRSRLRRPRAR